MNKKHKRILEAIFKHPVPTNVIFELHPNLHAALVKEAKQLKLSLNSYINQTLQQRVPA